MPVLTESELASIAPPGSVVRGVRLCVAPGQAYTRYHVPPELLPKSKAPERTGRRSSAPRKPGEPLERDIKRVVKPALEAQGWTVLDYEQDYRGENCRHCGEHLGRGAGSRVPLGTPDLYVLGFGVGFWIELKRPGGAVTEQQHRWHELARGNVPVYVVRSSRAAVELAHEIRAGGPPPAGEYPPPPEDEDEG